MLCEQEAVYKAQAEVFPFWGRKFEDIHEVEKYLSDILNSTWFFETFGPFPSVSIKEWKDKNRWAGCADAKIFTIYLKTGRQYESVVLHELAHILCGSADHGQCFVDTQLKLIYNTMGFVCFAEYKRALLMTGVFK
jgi:putative metallohydrolase (TIGR04338 family)